MNKNNPRLVVGRAQLIGDQLCALPIARYFKKLYPQSHLIWPVAKKVSQIAPIYLNCPWIDEIYVMDGQESWQSERDLAKLKSADYAMDVNPQHPDSRYPQEFCIYSETWRMAGLNYGIWKSLTDDEKQPQLTKWWNPLNKFPQDRKTIGIWPQAGYSRENKRNPSKQYWVKLINQLQQLKYDIVQFGAESDWEFSSTDTLCQVKRFNHLSLFDQIKLSLECNLSIGTDSGSALVLGGYKANFISLICIHWGNHNNPTALSTNNPNNFSFYSHNGTDDIDMDLVLAKIIEKIETKI